MAVIARNTIHVCPTHGIVLVRSAADGPGAECLTCGLRVAQYVPAEQHRGAVEALQECARLSGTDLSDGFPTSPDLATFAVECVRELRKDYDANGGQ